MEHPTEDALTGCLLGAALGDAIGLPWEGLSRSRVRRLMPDPLGHRFLLGRGMVSDDAEHACMTAQALIVSAGDPAAFGAALARQLRGWLLCAPAGIGLATLRALLRLSAGVGWERSGVWSAGNGPAMRAPLLGVAFGGRPDRLRELVRISTRITHTDPKAEQGALAIALAAHHAHLTARPDPAAYLANLRRALALDGGEILALAERAAQSADRGESTEAFADSLGLQTGVGGYILHTVPVAVQAWLRHPDDFREAITAVVRCGGDTDTTAAILGGVLGAGLGAAGLPPDWRAGLAEWPRSPAWMARTARRLHTVLREGCRNAPEPLAWAAVLPRNLLFTAAVLAHGFRRMFPPY